MHVQRGQFSSFFLPFLVKFGLFGVNLYHFQTNTIKKFRSKTKSEKNGPNGSTGFGTHHTTTISINTIYQFMFLWFLLAWDLFSVVMCVPGYPPIKTIVTEHSVLTTMAAIIAQITRNNREKKRKESLRCKEGIKCTNKLPSYENIYRPLVDNKYLAR